MDIQDKTNEELQKELTELQSEFSYLNALKDLDTAKRLKLEQELAVALQEIAFQNEEKEKRAAELIIANLELKFQSEEKAKRAAELVIANIELVFQNKEKAKRAAELIVANKELSSQNEEKGKRAAELIIALANAEKSEEKYSTIFTSMSEMVVLHELVFDENGEPINYRITDCNDAFTKITGISRNAAIGRLSTEVYGTEEPPYLSEFSEVALTGKPYHYETYFQPMHKHFSISVISQKKNRFATVTTDITKLKQSELLLQEKNEEIAAQNEELAAQNEELTQANQEYIVAKQKAEESEERFNLAMEASNDGLFDWNLETNEIYYSPSWKKMLGYEDDELPNDFSVWENTTDPVDVKKSWELQQKLINKEVDRFVLEFKMKHKNGH